MSKVIFLGTDLHGEPTELAAKTVKNLRTVIKESIVVSIEHRKKKVRKEGFIVIPKIFSNSRIRRIIQALYLPIMLVNLRVNGKDTLVSFWTANKSYHRTLFWLLKKIRYKMIFTIISGEETNFNVLKNCDLVVCQSETMAQKARQEISTEKVKVIYPGIDLNSFKPSNRKSGILIPSVPYSPNDFCERGIYEVLRVVKRLDIPTTIIFRSNESYNHVKKMDLSCAKLINRPLSDEALGRIMSKTKVIPLVYKRSPDVPLSAIEGLAAGCAIVTNSNLGISSLIAQYGAGIILDQKMDLESDIKKALIGSSLNKQARKLAEKKFDEKDFLKEYMKLIDNL